MKLRKEPPKPVYAGDREAFKMLQRLAAKGSLVNYNDAVAEKLVQDGLAVVSGNELLMTEKGRHTAWTFRADSP